MTTCSTCAEPPRFVVRRGVNTTPIMACGAHLADRISYALGQVPRVEVREVRLVEPAAA